jgi:hypothetical protein
MLDVIDVKIQLNVSRKIAEELYDEIEGHLALCIETVLERHESCLELSSILHSKLERIISVTALTGLLVEKLGNNKIRVTEVQIAQDPYSLTKNFYVTISVPNLWAANYGKDLLDDRLNDAVDFFKNSITRESIPKDSDSHLLSNYKWRDLSKSVTLFNGMPVNPLIGSVYYDQLSHSMKFWNGNEWNAI